MSRVWIYQAERKLKDNEASTVLDYMDQFVANWKAHGTPLKAEFNLLHNLFLVLKVDENHHEATGCSIDESVHTFKMLENKLGVKLFNRQRVAYIKGDQVIDCSMAEFKDALASGEVNASTIVFNNAIATLADFNSKWQVPASESWHKMLLK